ncbi:hypothetical protein LR48_Vigan767s000500 [Vigna angularis]|uniref:Uncharacterized protein n=1 Tax=Phaseolus angularis TaxID=3914 RepID=A0A0L9TH40_PHAAN|nr:hypothetical protein LR48_Vigan767s000500 [Vigna angularis]
MTSTVTTVSVAKTETVATVQNNLPINRPLSASERHFLTLTLYSLLSLSTLSLCSLLSVWSLRGASATAPSEESENLEEPLQDLLLQWKMKLVYLGQNYWLFLLGPQNVHQQSPQVQEWPSARSDHSDSAWLSAPITPAMWAQKLKAEKLFGQEHHTVESRIAGLVEA